MTTQPRERIAAREARNAWRRCYGKLREAGLLGRYILTSAERRFVASALRVAHVRVGERLSEFPNPSTEPVPVLAWWNDHQDQREAGYTSDRRAYRDLRGPVFGAVLP